MTWGRNDQPADAVDRLLDAAGDVFARDGVHTTTMRAVAEAAGCSRSTLYRYFPDADVLRAAFVERSARRVGSEVAAAVAAVDDPATRLVEAIVASLAEVRGDSVLSAWFEPAAAGPTGRVALQVEVVSRLIEPLVADLVGAARSSLATEWVVRVILSLLALPAEPAAERALLEDYLVASLGA